MTLTNLLLVCLGVLLALSLTGNLILVLLYDRTAMRWMRLFSSLQGIPPVNMESVKATMSHAPIPDKRKRVSVPIPIGGFRAPSGLSADYKKQLIAAEAAMKVNGGS